MYTSKELRIGHLGAILIIGCMHTLTTHAQTITEQVDQSGSYTPTPQQPVSTTEKLELSSDQTLTPKDVLEEGAPKRVKKVINQVEEKVVGKRQEGIISKIELGALTEIEAATSSDYAGVSDSGLTIATFQPYIVIRPSDWMLLNLALLYEQDVTNLEVDIASMSLSDKNKTPFYAIIGQTYMPFGNYDTSMISDPLTLVIGEAREKGIQLGYVKKNINLNAYIFSGEIDRSDEDETLNSFGASVSYTKKYYGNKLKMGAGYISNIGDSDTLQEIISKTNRVPGFSAYAKVDRGSFGFIAEYVTALDDFYAPNPDNAALGTRPSAYNVELGFRFGSFTKTSIISLGYQGTDDSVLIGLPKQRLLTAYRMYKVSNINLSFEYVYDRDYEVNEGGTGRNASSFTAQASIVF